MTLPQAPEGTAELFGESWPELLAYAEFLAAAGPRAGVIGPAETSRLWTRHIRNSVTLCPFIPPASAVIDLGSGAGLPGIPVALARRDLTVTLLEPLDRRVRFLREALDAADRPCSVLNGRAESAAIRAGIVVARAVAPLDRLLDLAQLLLPPSGGTLLALKGERAADEIDAVIKARSPDSTPGPTMTLQLEHVDWPDQARIVIANWA